MLARLTRYQGGSPEGMDDALAVKRKVLPTAFGQTEGMRGTIFLADRDSGTILAISLWEDEEALKESEDEAARLREEVTMEGEEASVERYEVALFAFSQAQA